MKIYFVQAHELVRADPNIQCFNLKADGIVIQQPGMILFRNHQEAQAAIDAAHAALRMNQEAENALKMKQEAENAESEDNQDGSST